MLEIHLAVDEFLWLMRVPAFVELGGRLAEFLDAAISIVDMLNQEVEKAMEHQASGGMWSRLQSSLDDMVPMLRMVTEQEFSISGATCRVGLEGRLDKTLVPKCVRVWAYNVDTTKTRERSRRDEQR
jgi:hypothetical protein